MVKATGIEPTTLWSRTIRATNCATPCYTNEDCMINPFKSQCENIENTRETMKNPFSVI